MFYDYDRFTRWFPLSHSRGTIDELCEATWIGFDLDDTLHDYTKASFQASYQTFVEIHKQYKTSIVALQKEYYLILHMKTATAFSDGKTSFVYRRDRFQALLEKFELPLEPDFLDKLGEVYERTLMESLERKAGVLELFVKLKQMDKKILIITEGPQDAQERTIEALGIGPYVDAIATSNQHGVSKIDGLVCKVLLELGIPKQDFVYLGDNRMRDIRPCEEESIRAIWVTPSHDVTDSVRWSAAPIVSSIWMLLSELHVKEWRKEGPKRKAKAWREEKARGWDLSRSKLGVSVSSQDPGSWYSADGYATSWAREWATEFGYLASW